MCDHCWIIVKANNQKNARLESIRFVLNLFPYKGKDDARVSVCPDPNVCMRYHRNIIKLD